jgi:hypothetical protein
MDDYLKDIVCSITLGEIQQDVMKKHFKGELDFLPTQDEPASMSTVFPELNESLEAA